MSHRLLLDIVGPVLILWGLWKSDIIPILRKYNSTVLWPWITKMWAKLSGFRERLMRKLMRRGPQSCEVYSKAATPGMVGYSQPHTRILSKYPDDASHEQRIEHLWDAINRLFIEVGDNFDYNRRQLGQHHATHCENHQRLEKSIEEHKASIREAGVQGAPVRLKGALLIGLGTLLSVIPSAWEGFAGIY